MKKVKRAAQRKPPENTKATPQQQGTAFLHALRREPLHPWNALRRRLTNVRKNSSPVRQFSASTAARQAPPFRPLPLMQRVAGAKAIPDARRADRAPQQARTSPRPQAGEGSRRCPMRHAADGVQLNLRDKFRVPAQRGVRGCRGCRGDFPLSPHAPRRAGDPPPAPGSSRDSQSDIGLL